MTANARGPTTQTVVRALRREQGSRPARTIADEPASR
jgi:hypothetical protein